MKIRFYLLTVIILMFLPMGMLWGDFQFSLGEYIVDDEPYPECLKEGKDGRIYISDNKSSTIKVFSAEGKYLYAIGGKGEGPGLFKRWAGTYDIDSKGEICQVDFFNGNRRITRFTPEGKLIESFMFQDPTKTGGYSISRRYNGNYIVNLSGPILLEQHNNLTYWGGINSFAIVNGKGVLKEAIREEKDFISVSLNANAGSVELPYTDFIISAYSPARDTLVFQKRAEDQVTIVDLTKKKTIRIPNGFKLTPLTKKDIDVWIEERKSIGSMYDLQLPLYKKFRANGPDFIKNKAIVDRLIFNPAGELFISFYDKAKKKYTVSKFSTANKRIETKVLDKVPAFIGKDRIYYMIYHEDEEMYTVEVKTKDAFFLRK